MKRIVFGLAFLVMLAASATHAKDIVVEPKGVYKTIDTRLTTATIKSLQAAKPGKDRNALIATIAGAPENYAPPLFYLLSSVLLQEGRSDEAMFWFYAGQLRCRIDANICADVSARNAVPTLNQMYGKPINQYAFQDIPKLKQTVEKVLAWEEKTGCKYDRRWINLHGMNAFGANTNAPLSAPSAEWEGIRKKTRDDYRASFYEMLKRLDVKKTVKPVATPK